VCEKEGETFATMPCPTVHIEGNPSQCWGRGGRGHVFTNVETVRSIIIIGDNDFINLKR
jgi:hypothetical protein